jgi:hypothetical protein
MVRISLFASKLPVASNSATNPDKALGGEFITTTGAVFTTGVATFATPFVTAFALIVAACAPELVCRGFVDGLVYATVTTSP